MNRTIAVKPTWPREFANAQFLAGLLLLLAALTFYYFAGTWDRLPQDNAARPCSASGRNGILRPGKSARSRWMAYHTNWLREITIKIPLWVPGADASLVKDAAGSRRRAGTVSHKPNHGAGPAFGCICFLRISGDAVDGRVCRAVAGNAPWLFHFLSFVIKRSECLAPDCTRLYVCIPGR